ncbi:MAG: NirD/YgiW/YdeI family stress tolerance protein [Comamonadaceae bacterium]|nr:MAG: NirD/YgiW/YdeI family stress tolerance protein [Comamonadaceae bacterium]
MTIGLLGSGTAVLAQYTGPSTAGAGAPATAAAPYSGPSSVPLMTVKQLLDTGKDNQHARLQGRIVSHDGGKNYTFADDSGKIPVEISAKRFPAGQTISAEQRVEILGEVDKDFRSMEFEVDQVRVIQ